MEVTVADLVSKLERDLIKSEKKAAYQILSFILNVSTSDLFFLNNRSLTCDQVLKFQSCIDRLKSKEPLAYIIGHVDFFNTQISVTPDVLIPRFETELLVEKVLENKGAHSFLNVLDLCCGSGCIGIALKKAKPDWRVVCSDISDSALELAKSNAQANNVDIGFIKSDLFEAFKEDEKFDIIVSNPPYISENEYHQLEVSVKNHEPKLALTPGYLGTECYQKIANSLQAHINEKALVAFEIGYNQKEALFKIFSNQKKVEVRGEKDYSGHDRFIFLEYQ